MLLKEIVLTNEWELEPAYLEAFARDIEQNFRTLQEQVTLIEKKINETYVQESLLERISDECKEASAIAQKAQFQSDQKSGYLQLQLDQFYELLKQNDATYNARLDEFSQILSNQQNLSSSYENAKNDEINALLAQRELEFTELRQELKNQQEIAQQITQQSQTELKLVFEKQTIYEKDFLELSADYQKGIAEIEDFKKNLAEKLQKFEQNYFVGLTARIIECEGKIEQNLGFSQNYQEKDKEVEEKITEMENDGLFQAKQNEQFAESISILQKQQDELQAQRQINQLTIDGVTQKINTFRADLGDLIDQEVRSRVEDSGRLLESIQQVREAIDELQEDFMGKINRCNDFVVHSGLQQEYNSSRYSNYSGELDAILEGNCLEVGQVKLLKAVTLRLREIENEVMEIQAKCGFD